jgi:hypothetical protein
MVPGYAVAHVVAYAVCMWQGMGKSGGKSGRQMLPARACCPDWCHGLSLWPCALRTAPARPLTRRA